MKMLSSVVLAVAVSFTSVQAGWAYQFSPSNITSHLKGRLTFTPSSGTGGSIRCKVEMILKTGNLNHGARTDQASALAGSPSAFLGR